MRPLSGAAAADNANSWKYAAAEIHQILAKARDAGTANLQVMEQKLAEMVVNMTDQSKLVSKWVAICLLLSSVLIISCVSICIM